MRAALIPLSLVLTTTAHAQALANAEIIRDALENATPGADLILAPGRYRFDRKIALNRPGAPNAPITLRADPPGSAELQFDAPEGLHVRAPHWRFEGLVIRGVCADHNRCEHAFHITGEADDIRVRDCELVDYNAHIKGNGEPVGDDEAYVWPDDVHIERTVFYNTTPRQTANPVTPIDVVGGRRWIIRDNFIHDHQKAQGDGISYAAFLKGNSRDGLFERNLVVCELLHRGGVRLGLSFGGGGSGPPRICEESTCTPEHQGGVMRNNIILDCPTDVGIYVNAGRDVQLLHNTLVGTTGVDLRFGSTRATVRGNVMDGRIRERDGGQGILTDNLEQADPAWFRDVAALDLSLVGDPPLVDQATEAVVTDDFCGRQRDGSHDLGALEYSAGPPCALDGPRGPAAPAPDAGAPPDGAAPPVDAEASDGRAPTDAGELGAPAECHPPGPAGPPGVNAPLRAPSPATSGPGWGGRGRELATASCTRASTTTS